MISQIDQVVYTVYYDTARINNFTFVDRFNSYYIANFYLHI